MHVRRFGRVGCWVWLSSCCAAVLSVPWTTPPTSFCAHLARSATEVARVAIEWLERGKHSDHVDITLLNAIATSMRRVEEGRHAHIRMDTPAPVLGTRASDIAAAAAIAGAGSDDGIEESKVNVTGVGSDVGTGVGQGESEVLAPLNTEVVGAGGGPLGPSEIGGGASLSPDRLTPEALYPTRTLLDEVGFPPLPRTRLPFLRRRCCVTSLGDLACVCSDRVRRTEIVESPVWHSSAE